MRFGALFLNDVPPDQVVEHAVRAETAGFEYVWTADSHIIWQDPWPIYGVIAQATQRVKFGPLVTNPGSRHWTVTASMLAVLNQLSGGRAVCGIGRGDSARRTLGLKPVTVREFEEAIIGIKGLVAGETVRIDNREHSLPWLEGNADGSEIWGAGYGPKVLDVVGRTCDGFVLQLADPEILEWTWGMVKDAAEKAGRPRDQVKAQILAPAYVSDDEERAHAQLRWFGGSVGNHVADLIKYHSAKEIPAVLTDFIENRPRYDYLKHDTIGNSATEYVPNEINRRFCIMGTVDDHIAKLRHLESLGVDLVTVMFVHDDMAGTMAAYADEIMPALRNPS